MQDFLRARRDAGLLRRAFSLDVYKILFLLLLAMTIRVWHISHTEVTARDGVGFIRYAWDLERLPWTQVFRSSPHPPLYPLTVLGVSVPTRQLMHADDVLAMQVSAQTASALAGVLLVIPMFLLGRDLVGSRSAFWATALFQCLPASSRVLSDALSEGVWLLLAATALLAALRGFRNQSWIALGVSGLCSGLAYLARPEGIMVALAIGLVLIGAQFTSRWRRPWPGVLGCAASLALGAVAVGGPYAAIIGHVTNKTTGIEILQTALEEGPKRSSWPATPSGADGGVQSASFGVYWLDARKSERGRRLVWGLKAVAGEYIKGFGYFAWLPALVGLCCCAGPFRRELGAWAVFALCLLFTLALWRVAYVAGYVSERHSLPVVMFGLYWMVAGVDWLCSRLVGAGNWVQARWGWAPRFRAREGMVAQVMLIAFAGVALPKSLEPLHANRAGFHAAGLWLAEHADPTDAIVDPFAWAEYYAGHALRDPRTVDAPPPSRQFVVVGGSGNEHARLPLMPAAETLANQGTLVYRWPIQQAKQKVEEVLVYCVSSKTAERNRPADP
jgi:Dolichyl-phosphate-mannose-protein mannosyltransferase